MHADSELPPLLAHDGCFRTQVFKSPDALSAFTAAKKLVDSLISRKIEITQDTIDAAKSNIVHNVVSGLHTLDDAVRLGPHSPAPLPTPVLLLTFDDYAGHCFVRRHSHPGPTQALQPRLARSRAGSLRRPSSPSTPTDFPTPAPQNVQLRDVLPAIEKWIRPIFDAETSIGVAATSSVQLQHIMEGFQKFGYDVEQKKV